MTNPLAEYMLKDLIKEKKELAEKISKASEDEYYLPQKELYEKLNKLNEAIQSKENKYNILAVSLLIMIMGLFINLFVILNGHEAKIITISIIIILILILAFYIFFEKTMVDIANGFLSLLKISFVILIIAYIALIFLWISEPPKGIMIQPFEISNLGKNVSGASTASLLSSELKGISDTNSRMQNETKLVNINYYALQVPSLYSKSIESSLSNIGSVGYGGSSLSLGQLSLSLKQLLHTQPKTIKGSLHEYGSTLYMVAEMDESSLQSTKIWKVSRNLTDMNESPDEAIPYVVKDLAHQIALDLGKLENSTEGKLPETWETFEYVNEAQKEYLEYLDTGKFAHLSSAEDNVLSALDSEPNYKIVFSLYREIGHEFLNKKKYNDSKRIFINIKNNYNQFLGSMDLGQLYYQQENYQDSIDEFNYALKLRPDNYYAWYYLGNSLYDSHRSEEADLAYNSALYYNSTYAHALNKIGEIFLEKGDNDKARGAFSNATIHDEKLGVAWYNYGRILYCNGSYNKANESFTRAANLSYSPAWNYIGLIAYINSNYSKAIRAYDYYLIKSPGNDIDDAIAWFNKGKACYNWNDSMTKMAIESFNQAIERFNKTICTDKDCMKINLNGWNDRAVPAINCFKIDILNIWANAWRYKGMAYYRLGEINQSIQANNTAIELENRIKVHSDGYDCLRRI